MIYCKVYVFCVQDRHGKTAIHSDHSNLIGELRRSSYKHPVTVACSVIGHSNSWIIIYFRAESSACTWNVQRASQTRHCSRPPVPCVEPRDPPAWRASSPRRLSRSQLARRGSPSSSGRYTLGLEGAASDRPGPRHLRLPRPKRRL